jgi:hypothetical protein
MKRPLDLYFKPNPDGFKDRILNVSPDILPPGSVKLTYCEVEGVPYKEYDADNLFVRLPDSTKAIHVKVTLTPA